MVKLRRSSRLNVPERSRSRDRDGLVGSPHWTGRASGLAVALVLAAATWARAAFLRYPFFADDYLFLDQTRGGSLLSAWAIRDPLRNYWRPLSRQVYFWLVTALGESPFVAHLLNLSLFLGILVLLFVLTRRLVDTRTAVTAAALVALHEVADVPVLWASGSQDLLAVAGALGAMCLAAYGRVGWAVVPFVCGLLSKETVVVTPVILLWMLREEGEPLLRSLRRIAPLVIATLVWLPIWALMMRGGYRQGLAFGLSSLPAAIAHLPQVFLGIEWGEGSPLSLPRVLPPLIPLLLLLVAILVGRARGPRPGDAAPRAGRGASIGFAWALMAAVPVSIVVHVWSSYFYLFAVCGLSMAVASLLQRFPTPASLIVVALVAWGSENARQTESFASAPGAWGTQSHLSRFYFDRSMRWIARYLEDLRRQRPTLPHRSTLYFAGIPAFASWQSGNGALVRWVYRDSTLKSFFFADFSRERARSGELFFFTAHGDSLIEAPGRAEGLFMVATGQLLSEHYRTALDAVMCSLDARPADQSLHYWRAWLGLALGDSAALRQELVAAGCTLEPAPSALLADVRRRIESGDAAGAMGVLASGVRLHALDPRLHRLLAGLVMKTVPNSAGGAMEALAARLLSPGDAYAWRLWAQAQIDGNHSNEAYASLTRYFELAGPEALKNAQDVRLLEQLRQGLPGGRLAQLELRRRPTPR